MVQPYLLYKRKKQGWDEQEKKESAVEIAGGCESPWHQRQTDVYVAQMCPTSVY